MHTRKRARRELEEHKKEDEADATTPVLVAASISSSRSEAGAAAAVAAAAAAPATVHESTASPAPNAAQQTLIAVIRAHPEEADRMLSVLQHHLAALFAPTASTSAAAAQSAASASHGPSPPRLQPQQVLALRERALVTPILAMVLSFLPPLERIELGRVSRQWSLALQHPSLWNGVGWHFPSDECEQELAMPEWIKQRMTVVRCGLEWLLKTELLSQFRAFTQLRRLDLLSYRWNEGKDVSESVLRQALQPLRLQTLTLPDLVPAEHDPLLPVLTRSTVARPSLLAAWAPALTELQLYVKVVDGGLLIQTFAELQWPALRSLTLTLIYKPRKPFVSSLPQLLQRALTPRRVPHLQTLHCRHERDRYMPEKSPGTFLASVWLPVLPRLESLTSLTLSSAHFLPPIPAPTLFQSIGALQSLRTLDLQGVVGPSSTVAEKREVERVLQRMDCLTQLAVVTSFAGGNKDWLHSLRLLPSLLTLRVDHKLYRGNDRLTPMQVDVYLHALSDLPRLQSLTFNVPEHTIRLAQLWWRRCGKPTLASDRFEHWQWQQRELAEYGGTALSSASASSSAAASPPTIRELRLPRSPDLDGICFAWLAHLPHLHTLEVSLQPEDIRHLSLLRQLRSLILWLHNGEPFHTRPLPWSNAALRSIGDTLMPQLHTLHLAGSNEDPVYDWCDPADPNFDWTMTHDDENIVDMDDHELEQPHRAELENISVEGGLRHLLQLPALTRLTLPYVPRDSVDYLHALAQQSGRSLLIESMTPLSRRSEFEGRWIDTNSPPFRPKLHTESLLASQFE